MYTCGVVNLARQPPGFDAVIILILNIFLLELCMWLFICVRACARLVVNSRYICTYARASSFKMIDISIFLTICFLFQLLDAFVGMWGRVSSGNIIEPAFERVLAPLPPSLRMSSFHQTKRHLAGALSFCVSIVRKCQTLCTPFKWWFCYVSFSLAV